MLVLGLVFLLVLVLGLVFLLDAEGITAGSVNADLGVPGSVLGVERELEFVVAVVLVEFRLEERPGAAVGGGEGVQGGRPRVATIDCDVRVVVGLQSDRALVFLVTLSGFCRDLAANERATRRVDPELGFAGDVLGVRGELELVVAVVLVEGGLDERPVVL